MPTSPGSPLAQLPTALRAVLALVAAAVVSSLLCLAVAQLAVAAGASSDFRPLQASTFVPLVVIGCLLGTVGWLLVRARSARPAAVLRWLVPAVLVVSLVPDLLVGVSQAQPGTSWGAVLALMVMHAVVAAVLVAALSTLVPVGSAARRAALA